MSFKAARSISLALALVLPAPALAEEAPECGTSYTVQQGDTVAAIAKRCGSTIEALISANPDLKNPARISIGQELALPGTTEQATEGTGGNATPDGGTEERAAEDDAAVPSEVTPADKAAGVSGDTQATESEAETAPAEADGAADILPEAGDEEEVDVEDASPAEEVEPVDQTGKVSSAATQPDDVTPAGEAEDEASEDAAEGAAGSEPIEPESAASIEPEPQLYTVQPGDSMALIASRLGLKLDALMAANEGVEPRALQPGQELVLPAPPETLEAPETPSPSSPADQAEALDDIDEAADRKEAAEPATPPLVLEGRIRRGTECPMLHTKEGETYSLVSQDYGFIPGDYVSIEGEAVEMSLCNRGQTVRVISMRVENETEAR